MKRLKPQSKAIFDQIQASCDIQQPNKAKAGVIDEVGSKQKDTLTFSIDGEKCPVSRTKKVLVDTTVSESNLQAEYSRSMNPDVYKKCRVVYVFVQNDSTETQIMDPELRSRIGMKEESLKLKMMGQMTNSNGKQSASKINSSGTLSRLPENDQKISIEVNMEVVQDGDRKEICGEFHFQFPSSSPVLQAMKDASGEKYYLNGELISKVEMKKTLW